MLSHRSVIGHRKIKAAAEVKQTTTFTAVYKIVQCGPVSAK